MAQVRFGGSEPRAGELGHSQSVETGGVRGPHTLPAGEAPAGSVCRERAWDGVARALDTRKTPETLHAAEPCWRLPLRLCGGGREAGPAQ